MQQRKGLQILVLDGNVDTLKAPLQADGHAVTTVGDGPSALQAAQTAPPDVVFLNFDVDGVDSCVVARQIMGLSAWKRPFLIALTHRTEEESSRCLARAGVDLRLTQPVPWDRLRGLLRRFQSIVEDIEDFDPMI